MYFRVAIFLMFTSSFLQAQDRCSITEYEKLGREKNTILERSKSFENWIIQKQAQRKLQSNSTQENADVTYTIPVVFHIVHTGEPVGTGVNIPDAQILSQIKVLNQDFQRLNADTSQTPLEFQPVAGSFSVEFVLARQDPNGEATNGVVRVRGAKNSWLLSEDAQLKSESYWPAENYLNIWVTDMATGIIGYAQFPQSTQLNGLEDAPNNRLTDGVILDYRAVGSINDGNFNLDSRYNRGRTATHEIGHFLGLRHIWGDDGSDCSGTDYVADTPNQAGSTTGCPTHPRSSCSTVNMFQNFLDYTNDVCMNLFTVGQVARMDIVLNNSPRRASLITSPGARAPDSGNLIVVDVGIIGYSNPTPVSCSQSAIPNITIKNTGTAILYSFKVNTSVNNGTPQSQTITSIGIEPNAEQSFNLNTVTLALGTNTISVELSEPNQTSDGNLSNNILIIITAVNNQRDIIPLRQSWETSFAEWSIVSQANVEAWKPIPTNKGTSLTYNAFTNTVINSESWLASPVLDLSSVVEASLFFDVSYGRRSPLDDQLKILVSKNCGVTYDQLPVYSKGGSELSTASASTSWLPISTSDWRREYVNLNDYVGEKEVRLAFVATNRNGNNLYIDNLEFYENDDFNPLAIENEYSIYSGSQDFRITFNLPERENVRMQIYNLTGQLVIDNLLDNVLNQTFDVDFSPQSSGIYLVRLQIGDQLSTRKVFVSR